jgi:hypothetical protein
VLIASAETGNTDLAFSSAEFLPRDSNYTLSLTPNGSKL